MASSSPHKIEMALDKKNEMPLRTIPKQLGITKPTGIALPLMTTKKLTQSYLREEQASVKEFLTHLHKTMFHSVHGTGSYIPKTLEFALYVTGLQKMRSLADHIWLTSSEKQRRKWPAIQVNDGEIRIHKTPRMCFQGETFSDLDLDLQSLRFRIYWQNVCDFYGKPAHCLISPYDVVHTLKLAKADKIVIALKNRCIETKKETRKTYLFQRRAKYPTQDRNGSGYKDRNIIKANSQTVWHNKTHWSSYATIDYC